MSHSAAQIIDENGGPAAFAEKVGRKPGAVRLWKHRNKLPREAWPEIIQAFPGLTLERLIAVEAENDCLATPSHLSAPVVGRETSQDTLAREVPLTVHRPDNTGLHPGVTGSQSR